MNWLTPKAKYCLLYGGIQLFASLGAITKPSWQTICMAIASAGLTIKAYLSNPKPL